MTLPYTTPELSHERSDSDIALVESVTAAQLPPAAGRASPTAEGAWVTDVDGRRYLDCLAGYSALNFGHGHPALLAAARAQLDRLTLTSRAFHNDQLGPFCRDLAALAGMEMVLPMNTGAEAVETAVKVARKWGYDVKGVAAGPGHHHRRGGQLPRAHHDDHQLLHRPPRARRVRPVHPGLPDGAVRRRGRAAGGRRRDHGGGPARADPGRGRRAGSRRPATCPASGEICTSANVLLVADEIQSGLGRTGSTFACDHEGVVPDVYVLGKALGGGIVPVSAVVVQPRRARRADARDPRVHVRRQPAGLRGRPRGRRAARDR